MWLPMDPQKIDFKTYLGFTDGVLWAERLPCPICPGRVDDRYEARRANVPHHGSQLDGRRETRSLADGMGNDRRVTVIAPLHSSCGPFRFHISKTAARPVS